MEVVLVDGHDYHTFQPLIYQVATDLLAGPSSGIRSGTSSTSSRTSGCIKRPRRSSTSRPTGPVRGDGADHLRPAGARAGRSRQLLRGRRCAGPRVPDVHAGRRDAYPRAHPGEVAGGGSGPSDDRRRRAERRDRRGRADRRRERRGYGRALPQQLREGLSRHPPGQGRLTLVEGGPVLFSMFKPKLQRYAKEALEKRGVDVVLGEVVASVEPTRVTLRSGTELKAHTLVWGAGCRRIPSPPRSASISRRVTGSRSGPTSASPGTPRCSPWGTSPGSPTRRRVRCSRNSARWPSSPESTPERTSRGRSRGRRRSPSSTRTRERWRRSAAARPSCSSIVGRTMTGKKASLAWGAVHLALLVQGRGPSEGGRRVDVGGFHPRAIGPDHREDRRGVINMADGGDRRQEHPRTCSWSSGSRATWRR